MMACGFVVFVLAGRNLWLRPIHAFFPILSWNERWKVFCRKTHDCFSTELQSRWPARRRTPAIRPRGVGPRPRAIFRRAGAVTPKRYGDPPGCGCGARTHEL